MNYTKITHTSCRKVAVIFIGALLVFGISVAEAASKTRGHRISGAVNGAILSGVTINLTGAATASATTDAVGKYHFATLASGSYTVTPSKTGYTFNPPSFSVSMSGTNASVKSFTATGQLNDTGTSISSQCYQAGSNDLVACNSAGAIALNSAQDAMSGRDVNVDTNSNADGKLGFNFTSVTGGCILDNVTSLMWEVKTADGGLRDWNKIYTNYDITKTTQKLNAAEFVAPTQAEIDAPTNSVSFKHSVNTQGLCGYNDWRLPTAGELQSIVDYGVGPPGGITVDPAWLPNTQATDYWSASPDIGDPRRAWLVDFSDGSVGFDIRRKAHYVRLVRSSQ